MLPISFMANITTIRANITRQLGEQAGAYTDVFLTDYINMAYDYVVAVASNSSNDTVFDDPNWGDTAIGYINLVSGQSEYRLYEDEDNTDITNIFKVFLKNKSSTNYSQLERTNIQTNPSFADEGVTGSVNTYMYSGGTVIFDSIPGESVTKGIKYYYSRAQKPFVEGDTSAEPGFSSLFHNLITFYAAYMIAGKEGKTGVQNNNIALFTNLLSQFTIHLNNKNPDRAIVFLPVSKVIK